MRGCVRLRTQTSAHGISDGSSENSDSPSEKPARFPGDYSWIGQHTSFLLAITSLAFYCARFSMERLALFISLQQQLAQIFAG